jgi:hypothetical protein
LSRAALAAAALLAALACREASVPAPSIGTRVTIDRVETQVGDPVGVTVEVETPAGFRVQTPPAPSGGVRFDSVELVEPIATPGPPPSPALGRARDRRSHPPWLDIPLVRPDGAVQALRVGGVPLAVRSVRADLPGREAIFDIRTAPPDTPTPLWVWALAAAGLALAVFTVRVIRSRARAVQVAGTKLADAGRAALAAIDEAERDTDARAYAGRVRGALLDFIAGVWSVDTVSTTPGELPAPVDRELVGVLGALELARFAPRPLLAPLVPLASKARERVRHVANLRA